MKLKGKATIDDLMRMPKDGVKHELVDGEIVMSPAGMRHSAVAAKILGVIFVFYRTIRSVRFYGSDGGSSFRTGMCAHPMSPSSATPNYPISNLPKPSARSYLISLSRSYHPATVCDLLAKRLASTSKMAYHWYGWSIPA